MRLKDVALVFKGNKVDLKEGDISIIARHGNPDALGKPMIGAHLQSPTNCIVIRVNRPDIIDTRYLYYTLMYLHQRGLFKQLAKGTGIQYLTVQDVEDIKFGQVGQQP